MSMILHQMAEKMMQRQQQLADRDHSEPVC